jgi:hypothetical protein
MPRIVIMTGLLKISFCDDLIHGGKSQSKPQETSYGVFTKEMFSAMAGYQPVKKYNVLI